MANQGQTIVDLDVGSDQATSAEVLSTWVHDARARSLQLAEVLR